MRYSDTERVFDELLLMRIQTGDRQAGERLAARWYPRLMRTAFRLLRDEEQAQVAVQEAWSGICKGWRGLRSPNRFPAWAYTILHRRCADRIKRNQSDRSRFGELPAGFEPSIAARGEDKVSIDQAFDLLSAEHRTAAILYFSEGLTAKEVAEVTGTAIGTAKSRLFHARRHLQNMLNEQTKSEGEDDDKI